jgi:hypothetical protein
VCLYAIAASKSCTNIPYFFLSYLVSISSLMNAKINNFKFKGEVKSNGNTLLHTEFFTSVSHEHNEFRKISSLFLVCPIPICRPMHAKKKLEIRGKCTISRRTWNNQEFCVQGCPTLAMMHTCPCNAEAHCSFEK